MEKIFQMNILMCARYPWWVNDLCVALVSSEGLESVWGGGEADLWVVACCCNEGGGCCSVVGLLSHVRLFATPWTAARQASLSFTNSRSLLKLMSIESVMLSIHLVLSSPSSLLSVFPSVRIFFNWVGSLHQVAKHWSFSFSINPSNEYSGLISFRVDWFDLLAVQGTLKSLLQHHISKAAILWRSAFFMVHLSHPYMTTGKTIPLTIRTFVSKLEVPHLLRAAVEGRFIKAFRRNDC